MKLSTRLLAIGLGSALASLATAAGLPTADYLTPRIQMAVTYSNVFSISRSIKADGFDELVGRNGGSADYSVTAASPPWRFRMAYRYDGQPVGTEDYELRDGGRTACNDGKCAPYTDASGLIYNPALWGSPPERLMVGGRWKVSIAEPWELGGSKGNETVTVIRLDPKSGRSLSCGKARVMGLLPTKEHRSK